MEKTFSKIEISAIKATAKNVAPFVAKKAKVDAQIEEVKEKLQKVLEEKIQKLEAEKEGYQAIIESMNSTVKKITGGYTTEDLVTVTKEGTGKTGENGKEIMKTVYTLKYPDTVIPPHSEAAPATTEEATTEVAEEAVNEAEPSNDELPEELAQERAETAEEAISADPFEGMVADSNPFN